MKFLKNYVLAFRLSIIVGVLIAFSAFFLFRIDLTSDKRYSISPQTKKLMRTASAPINAVVYLTGDLNVGFLRLKNSIGDMLAELNAYSGSGVYVSYENPSNGSTALERESNYAKLERRGMAGTMVYDKDKEGKNMQKMVYPWLELSYRDKTVVVNLLKNDRLRSGEENLNMSIESLEFELADAIRRLLKTEVDKIAFLEGHGELSEWETFGAMQDLSRYFQIDRGVISADAEVIDVYKAIIVAKPMKPFSEKDKFVLDQYLMRGGAVLWLVDGVKVSEETLSKKGMTLAIPLDLNLNDLFFRYGVRLHPIIVEDVQSTLIPVNVASAGQKAEFIPMPWIYSPLLLASMEHPATKNLPPVKARFASMLQSVGNENVSIKHVILASSSNAHITQTPAYISLAAIPDLKDKHYFNQSFVPVGIILEGTFSSVFANRMPPPELVNARPVIKSSVETRQAVIANGDIIRNEIRHVGDTIEAIPLGFDRYMNQQFGNNQFITNLMLYLTDNEGWMDLRSRSFPLRLLNKNKVIEERVKWQVINVLTPLIILLLFGIIYTWRRKRKYE